MKNTTHITIIGIFSLFSISIYLISGAHIQRIFFERKSDNRY